MSFEPNIFVDFTLQNLGDFLKDSLNERSIKSLSTRPEMFPQGYPPIVTNVFLADFPNMSTIEHSFLKIYRTNCESYRYKDGNGVRTCNVVIEYCLAYAELKAIPNLLNWVDFHIQQLLLNYEYAEFPIGKPIQEDLRFIPDRSEYRTGVNTLTQEAYPLLRLIVRLRDDACPTPRNKEQFDFENCC